MLLLPACIVASAPTKKVLFVPISYSLKTIRNVNVQSPAPNYMNKNKKEKVDFTELSYRLQELIKAQEELNNALEDSQRARRDRQASEHKVDMQ